MEIEAPGMRGEDLDTTLEGNILTVSGGQGNAHERRKRERYRRMERWHGNFARLFTSPFDPNDVEAKYEHGIRHVTMTKKPTPGRANQGE
jgi:HSP20 family molecular chaperone IbpA